MLSRHMPRHRRGHDGGWRGDNRRLLRRCAAGGWANVEKHDGKPHRCNGIRSQDSPSGNSGRRPSGSFRRKPCYGQQGAGPQSAALSASIPRGRRAPLPYPNDRDRGPGCTRSYSSWAPAESANRTNPQSHHHAQSPRQQSRHWYARCWPSRNRLLQSLSLVFLIFGEHLSFSKRSGKVKAT